MLSAVNNYLVCYLFAVWRPVLVATGIKENSDTSITLAILKKREFWTYSVLVSVHTFKPKYSVCWHKQENILRSYKGLFHHFSFWAVTDCCPVPKLRGSHPSNPSHCSLALSKQKALHWTFFTSRCQYFILKKWGEIVANINECESGNERVKAVSERRSESAYFSLLSVCLCPCVSVGQSCKHYSWNG